MKKYLLLFAMLLSLGASNVYAQCPATNVPPAPCAGAWTAAGPVTVQVTVNGITCWWTITYCYRTSGCTAPNTDIYIVSVSVPGYPTPCYQNLPAWEQNKIAGNYILKHNPENFDWPCPPCDPNNPGIVNSQVYYGACYSGNIQCAAVAYCQNKYYMCCDPVTGERIVTYIGSEAIGDCVIGEGCDTHCE